MNKHRYKIRHVKKITLQLCTETVRLLSNDSLTLVWGGGGTGSVIDTDGNATTCHNK